MKIAMTIARILVGLLFIFSGLVKANDPHGLSYKMQEFFEIWEVEQFNSRTLFLSVLMNAFEIIAGFALLLGWRVKLFSWLLLLLILFFTFLTGYTYITGKPTNCGCFGDCIPISSKVSFLKDLILTALIGFLFWQRDRIRPVFGKLATTLSMLGVTIFSFGFQWYTLNYLPVVDCLPFKKGNNISEKMKMPLNAIPDVTVITYVYEKDGKEIEFTADNFPDDFDSTYKMLERYDKVVQKGKNNQPPIKGFQLSGITKEDSTGYVLTRHYAILLFCEDFSTPVSRWKDGFATLYNEAKAKNIPVYVVTTQLSAAWKNLAGTAFADAPVFTCDYTALRTAARANPTVYLLREGTVVDKQSHRRIKKIEKKVEELPVQEPVAPPVMKQPQEDSSNLQTETGNP